MAGSSLPKADNPLNGLNHLSVPFVLVLAVYVQVHSDQNDQSGPYVSKGTLSKFKIVGEIANYCDSIVYIGVV